MMNNHHDDLLSTTEVVQKQQPRHRSVVEMLRSAETTTICAPMVRYSKMPFRHLVRRYACDIAYTPMIISDSFLQSASCRDSEFTTNALDRPLVVQFAAAKPRDFADAAEMVAPYADGVGLNAGCPQRWAMKEGYGAEMIKKPELLKDYVRMARAQCAGAGDDFAVSVKIRLHKDVKRTVEMCQQLEHVGVSYIDVHGRTAVERHQPVHYDAIKLIKENVGVPVVANGDVTSLKEVEQIADVTSGCFVLYLKCCCCILSIKLKLLFQFNIITRRLSQNVV